MSRALVALLLASCAPAEGPRTFHVHPAPDGELDDPNFTPVNGWFTTIQSAIDASSEGDTITIGAGTFVEDLTVTHSLTLDGAGRGETWVVGSLDITGVSSAEVREMSFYDAATYNGTGTYGDNGITLTSSQEVLVEQVDLYYFNVAVLVDSSWDVDLNRLVLGYNWYGLGDVSSTNTVLTNSLVASNPAGGTYSTGGVNTLISNNTFVGNGFQGSSNYLSGAIALGGSGSEVVWNNVLTSNYYGINCAACSSTWGYNDVWGNTTDYVNDASADATDISVDPEFIDAANGNYALSEGSACIDAGGATWASSEDYHGESRPQGGGYDIGADEYASSTVDLVISEVMANPSNETTGEYVEIYNRGTGSVDLDGMFIGDGDDWDNITSWNGGSTTLPAGGYAVVVDTDYAGEYSIPSSAVVVVIGDNRIGNGMTTSDPITLVEADGTRVAARFSYPADPGDGDSMEMVDLEVGDAAGNWRPSVCSAGHSPGEAACFPPSGDPSGLVMTEVMANAVNESTGEYIELYNPTTLEIDASGLIIEDGGGFTDALVGYLGGPTLIGPGDHALIVDPDYTYDYYLPTDIVLLTTTDSTLGNGLSNSSDSVTLYLADGVTVIDEYAFPIDPGDGVSMEKVVYTQGASASNWAAADTYCTRGASPGRLNGWADGVCDPILITEVMANPIDEGTGEFIELYNAGWDSVDLEGWVLYDGIQLDTLESYDGGATTLDPGGYALILDAGYDDDYASADLSGAVLLTTGDSNLGNGLAVSDTLELFESDGMSLVDAFLYPSNPGNGVSVERVSLGGALDAATNWVASTCASGASPAAENCVASGSTGQSESSYDLLITEVMANAIDEDTGEYVEIYNAGSTAVDLLGFVIWDGDAIDTIHGFSDYWDATLEPGAYALILDAEYAGEYTDIPSDTLLLVTDDTTIGSGLATSDPISFYEGDAASLIDTFSFPSNPGNGVSLERVSLSVGDEASNWAASGCTATPGYANCQ
ncbi:MAG: lamin tail domain-containing protein [Alphaproteobacteria bacterium]|nr:lamin tail domain-containing protein [Alphaproteobacteria bacterium]MCB9795952.1 lamin tail domain-containing protein [Alphaproteobacteria bacterium]